MLMATCCCGCGYGPEAFSVASTDPAQQYGFDSHRFGTSGPDPAWMASGGALSLTSARGSFSRISPLPPPDWKHSGMSVSAKVIKTLGSQREGVFINNARGLYIDWAANKYRRRSSDAWGDVATGSSTDLPGTPTAAQNMQLTMTGNTDGTFDFRYVVAGGVIATETNVTLPAFDSAAAVRAGVWGETEGQFDDVRLACGLPTTCCPSISSTICARITNFCGFLANDGDVFTMSFDAVQRKWIGTWPGKGDVTINQSCVATVPTSVFASPFHTVNPSGSAQCVPSTLLQYVVNVTSSTAYLISVYDSTSPSCTWDGKVSVCGCSGSTPWGPSSPIPLPRTMHATVTTANCACFLGAACTLTFQTRTGGTAYWSGSFTACGRSYQFDLFGFDSFGTTPFQAAIYNADHSCRAGFQTLSDYFCRPVRLVLHQTTGPFMLGSCCAPAIGTNVSMIITVTE